MTESESVVMTAARSEEQMGLMKAVQSVVELVAHLAVTSDIRSVVRLVHELAALWAEKTEYVSAGHWEVGWVEMMAARTGI